MPVDYKRYPSDWKQITARIREREGNCCKFCGVRNGAVGYRKADGSFVQLAKSVYEVGMEVEVAGLVDRRKIIKIVLTVAHLGIGKPEGLPGDKHDKMDVRDDNLAALCQQCHLRLDIDEHRVNASATRARRKSAGMDTLFS